mmetsp:Transcript_90673/g.180312  ORF Transcript_90673/g.180312 Transcript_90673/m.180312 type:complete len:972 (+) Transcript_90673:67-2982(+)
MSQANAEVTTDDEERAQQVPLVGTYEQQQQVLTHWLKANGQAPRHRPQSPQRLHPLICKGLVAVACGVVVFVVLHRTTERWNCRWHHQDALENKDHEVDNLPGEQPGYEEQCKADSAEGPVFPISFEGPVGSCPARWTCTGAETQICALGSRTSVCNHPGIDNVEGTHYFNVGNDMGTGTATSSTFVLPENIYSVFFRRSGGADEGSGVYILRHSDDEVICAAEEGRNSNVMVEQWCNAVKKYAGQSVYIVIKDSQSSEWGKVIVDNFRLLDKSGNDLNTERNTTNLMSGQDELASKNCFLKKSGYISPGGDIFAEKTTPTVAKAKCRAMPGCCGITHEDSPEAAANMPVPVYFKGVCDPGERSWKSYYLEVPLDDPSGAEALVSPERAGGHKHHEDSSDRLHNKEPIIKAGEAAQQSHGAKGAEGRHSHDAHEATQPSDRQHAASHGAPHATGEEEDGHGDGHELRPKHAHSHGHGDPHGGHGSHGHGGNELVSKTAVDQAVASMLLGSIAFHTSLFYLVNFNDDDMRRHSWSVLSSTIAIFSAVLVFKGLKGVMVYLIQLHLLQVFTVEQEAVELIGLAYLEVLTFFTALQYMIYRIASSDVYRIANSEDGPNSELDQAQRMTCWSTILAHMSAFAAMDAGVEMQMTDAFKQHPLLAFVPVFVNIFILFILFRIADHIRAGCSRFGCKHEVLLKWDEVSEDGENDFGGLGISFLLAEAIKYNVTGEFTKVHSAVHGRDSHHPKAVRPVDEAKLFFIGLAFAGLSVFVVWLREKRRQRSRSLVAEDVNEEEGFVLGDFNKYLKRWFFIFQTVFAMCFAWCLLSTVTWAGSKLLHDIGFFFDKPHTTGQDATIALIVSFLAFCLIRVLDLIEDMEATGEVTDKCTRSMIDSLAILIGFSWEHAFERGVKVIAATTRSRGNWCPAIAKFLLAISVALVVIPAWRLYILKMVLKLRKERKEDKENPRSPRSSR